MICISWIHWLINPNVILTINWGFNTTFEKPSTKKWKKAITYSNSNIKNSKMYHNGSWWTSCCTFLFSLELHNFFEMKLTFNVCIGGQLYVTLKCTMKNLRKNVLLTNCTHYIYVVASEFSFNCNYFYQLIVKCVVHIGLFDKTIKSYQLRKMIYY